jgi:hypothetical protein
MMEWKALGLRKTKNPLAGLVPAKGRYLIAESVGIERR